MPRVTLALLVAFILTACAAEVKGPSVAVRAPAVVLGDDHHHGGFCPPGQAKKGRC